MTDVIDEGSRVEAQFTEMAVARQLAAAAKAKSGHPLSAENCTECGDEIPQKRREHVLGCQYCTGCQALNEKGRL